jgi:FKBP-type peptidyl-prolyl cis-trans isomerase
MRRRFALPVAVLLAVPLSLAACGGGDELPVKVTGEYGKRPEVTIPGERPGEKLVISELVPGQGTPVHKGDLVVAHYVGYRWNASGSRQVADSFANGQPQAFPSGRLVPGLDKALTGRRAGTRVAAVIPPSEGYGDKGDSRHQVAAGDSLVYVLDVLGSYPRTAAASGRAAAPDAKLPAVAPAEPGRAPVVTIPQSRPPSRLRTGTLIEGQGPPVAKGKLAVLHFTGVSWRTGQEFYSTWNSEGRPAAEVLGVGQHIKAFDEGLVGRRVGSRMLLVVPPRWGYGKDGLSQYGIKGSDTLVYVVDILGAY